MSIIAARGGAGGLVGAWGGTGRAGAEARARPRGVGSTRPCDCGAASWWSWARASSRICESRCSSSSSSSQAPRRRRSTRSSSSGGGGGGGADASLRIGQACLGRCRSGGELFRLRAGRRRAPSVVAAAAAVPLSAAAAAAARGLVDECPRFRYATEIRSRPSAASCVFALATMRGRGDGWKRAGAGAGGALEQQARKNSFSRGAFADDDNMSGAPLMNNGNSDNIVPPPVHTTKLLTLPTILTLARVAAVPAILAVFYCKETWATAAGAAIFIIAAITDWLDGYLARKMGSSSAFGAFLDPVADKLMVAAALVLLCTRPLPMSGFATIPWLLPVPTIAIIGREITMSAVREWAAAQGADVLKAVAVNNLGKIKTASQMIAITLLLATGDGGLDSKIASYLGIALLYIAAGLALWSLALYMKGIWGFLSK
ncbi:hypothetical protein Mp_4g06340 [Marchantia polymorpha subsp. ruderalis]|nr:hypothetical protein MARPO_0114s0019 [Marchantia polymorpha]BBN07773.1 hypothetical protein Mp_4g06340 [Marchantia polymorpha subsp. ruderalis]|eukprot:PTQ31199.1 hypothetical protein MARPO_0114s0019 [Marchantia polymorpha]